MKTKSQNKEHKMQKILFSWLMAFLAVGFVGCGVGESCDNTQIKDVLVEQIKSSLLKAHPEFSEQIQKTAITLGEITTMQEQETHNGRKLRCSVKEIKVKLDSGDTLSYKQGSTSFFGIEVPDFLYEVEFTQNEFRLFNLGNIMSFFGSGYKGEIGENLKAYYSGDGLVIDGVRKGGCNGIKQLKDKNGKVLAECTNGLRNGVYKEFDKAGDIAAMGNYTPEGKDGLWKYYKDGLLYKEQNYKNNKLNGKRTDYDKLSGEVRYVWEFEEDRLLRTYNEDGNITFFAQYKNGEPEKAWYGDARGKEDYYPTKHYFAFNWSGHGHIYPDYIEYLNGKPIVWRDYKTSLKRSRVEIRSPEGFNSDKYLIKNDKVYQSEQEQFAYLQTLKPIREKIVIDNLEMRFYETSRLYDKKYIPSGGIMVEMVEELKIYEIFFEVQFFKNYSHIGTVSSLGKGDGLCQQKGKCEEMFKAVIDRSAYKDEIYAWLSGKENSLNSQSPENKPNLQNEAKTQNEASVANEPTQSVNENSSQSSVKPSFDCNKASTTTERLVCSDDELANLDLKLANAYKNARNLADAAGKKKILEEQKIWLKAYNLCNDKDCVKQNLEQRIKALNQMSGAR